LPSLTLRAGVLAHGDRGSLTRFSRIRSMPTTRWCALGCASSRLFCPGRTTAEPMGAWGRAGETATGARLLDPKREQASALERSRCARTQLTREDQTDPATPPFVLLHLLVPVSRDRLRCDRPAGKRGREASRFRRESLAWSLLRPGSSRRNSAYGDRYGTAFQTSVLG
jgi:hypothetical protein